MMNKFKFIFFLVLLSSPTLFGQSLEGLKTQALIDAKATSNATLKKDFKIVLKHTYPPILKLMGGKGNALTTIENMFNTMETQGFVFEKADILSVSNVVKEQNQYRCIVEGFNQIAMSGQRISSKSYLLGIYNEDDKLWCFLEAKQLKNKALLEQVLPDFKTSLQIPEGEMKTTPIDD